MAEHVLKSAKLEYWSCVIVKGVSAMLILIVPSVSTGLKTEMLEVDAPKG